MFTRVATALIGGVGGVFIAIALIEEGSELGPFLPGAVIGLLITIPFLLYGVLGAERFVRVLPPLAFLVEDPQARDASDEEGD